jgi:hypothetical protein
VSGSNVTVRGPGGGSGVDVVGIVMGAERVVVDASSAVVTGSCDVEWVCREFS